jgi:NAD(P)-dependent dehydrogenase (short-subunit alcohol dehydrogenase family)
MTAWCSLLTGRLNPPLDEWAGRWVWIIGASTGIGRAVAQALHAKGAQVVVSGRQAAALADFVQTHPGSMALPLDVTDLSSVQAAAHTVWSHCGPAGVGLVLYCAGHYRPQRATALDLPDMQRHLAVNYQGALHVLEATLPPLLQQQHGHLSLVGSVAGYRGLPQSLAYGPTKAALHNLAENLYLDLHPQGLGVSIVNPGFVDTPLTAGNRFHMPGLLQPEEAAERMLRGWARGRFEIHFPWRFTVWLRLLRCLPDAWYFALVRRATGL